MTDPERQVLSLPAVDPAHYDKNFIRLAVCELRFPTLLELETTAPRIFTRALRSEFPTYEKRTALSATQENTIVGATQHTYLSKKSRWTVSVRSTALSLETSRYDSFEDFKKRLAFVLNAAKEMIDSDFFTRVGLRYQNVLPYKRDDISSWVNRDLVAPLAAGTFGDVDEHWQRVRGVTQEGYSYIFQHGVSVGPTPEYVLDIDFFVEDLQFSDTLQTVEGLHRCAFAMFCWSLGSVAKAQLGMTK